MVGWGHIGIGGSDDRHRGLRSRYLELELVLVVGVVVAAEAQQVRYFGVEAVVVVALELVNCFVVMADLLYRQGLTLFEERVLVCRADPSAVLSLGELLVVSVHRRRGVHRYMVVAALVQLSSTDTRELIGTRCLVVHQD